jgi:phosphoglycolate phosphatase
MIEQALRRTGARDDVDRMLAEFLVHHEANIANDSRPFPGAVAALEVLASQGATLAVCTNKREHLSRKLLEELDLTRYFAGLAGRDTFPVSKPDPGHLTGVIALAGGDPSRAVMVGDSETDLATAKAAGVPAILVRFGYATSPLNGSGGGDRSFRRAAGAGPRPVERSTRRPRTPLNASIPPQMGA